MANGSQLLNISSKGAVLPGCNAVNSLHASALCSEYNERFNLIYKEVVGDFIRFLQLSVFIMR